MTKVSFLEIDFRDYAGEQLPEAFQFATDDQDLVDFYREDAQKVSDESISKVVNVFYQGNFVGYFAYAASEINALHLKESDRYAPFPHPAIKLGRLLICSSMRGCGVGTAVLQKVATIALDVREIVPIRFLIVDAVPNAVQFYVKNGFVDSGIRRGSNRDLSILYIDLKHLDLR